MARTLLFGDLVGQGHRGQRVQSWFLHAHFHHFCKEIPLKDKVNAVVLIVNYCQRSCDLGIQGHRGQLVKISIKIYIFVRFKCIVSCNTLKCPGFKE